MTQARRWDSIGQFETSYRTPGSAAAKIIPFSTLDGMRDARRQQNNTGSSRPLGNKTDRGDPTYGGSFQSIFELRAMGFFLKALLGNPTTGKAVTTQPVNVTGVSVNYAQSACATGNGTLTYTSS